MSGLSPLAAHVAQRLARSVRPGTRLCVALSGGMDSVVLLDVMAELAPRLDFALYARHVNHGLSPNARRWEAFCRTLCAARGVPFAATRARVARDAPEGLEAAARAARYAALARAKAEVIALGHHQDDQAETLLLQLLRGAGVKGLAGMGETRGQPGGGPLWLRPLLDLPRSRLAEHARVRGLQWIEDESNSDARFDRNYLRLEVIPRLRARFPATGEALGRAAAHLAEAAELLDALAAQDAGEAASPGRLVVAALRPLSPARARNLLRWFIARTGAPMPEAARLTTLLDQALAARPDAQLRVAWGDWEARRFAGELWLQRAVPAPPGEFVRRWDGGRLLHLPELGGRLVFRAALGQGIARARLAGARREVRLRRGGERLRPAPGGPSRTLKNLWQEAHVPPWERSRLPLLFVDGALAWVSGIGVDAAFACARGEPGTLPVWEPVARIAG